MHRNWTRTLSLTGTFARRLALQALVSGTVMIALQAASRMEHTLAGVDWTRLADGDGSFTRSPPISRADGAARPGPTVDEPTTPAAVASVAPASLREARLPVPAGEDMRLRSSGVGDVAALTRSRAMSRTAPPAPTRDTAPRSVASETVRFDECHPACESRDPLLLRVAQREPTTAALDGDTEGSAASTQRTIARSTQGDGDGARRPTPVEPATPTRVGALWNGVLGGWQTARQATGSMVGRLGETVGLASSER